MRCKHCNARLAVHDIWCSNCGHQTEIVRKDLSAWASIKKTWGQYRTYKSSSAPAAAFSVVAGLIPIALVLIILQQFGYLNIIANNDTGSLFINLIITSIAITALMPILFVPFVNVCKTEEYRLALKPLLSTLGYYPKYLVLSLLIVVFYAIIFVICFGLPIFGSDPILRLVWLVLANYFLAIVLPVPVLMQRINLNAWKALRVSYKYFHVVRWQKYLLVLILFCLNLIAALLFVFPLLITLPFTWFAIRDYTDLMLGYEMIREDKQG